MSQIGDFMVLSPGGLRVLVAFVAKQSDASRSMTCRIRQGILCVGVALCRQAAASRVTPSFRARVSESPEIHFFEHSWRPDAPGLTAGELATTKREVAPPKNALRRPCHRPFAG
jgi:hypothetical protein